jgi:Zn-dependent peptidase ImmA (M78 family)
MIPGRKARQWRHPSVLALKEACGGDLCPEQIIRMRAEELTRYARGLGWSGPPYNPRILASLLGIRVREARLGPATDGALTADGRGGLEILVNASSPPSRQSFTICHEVAHTLFPDHCEFARRRQAGGVSETSHHELEGLCNLAASELLMPMAAFARDVVYHGLSLASVAPLAGRYGASAEAVLRRMVATDLETCCAVFLRRMLKPSETSEIARPGPDIPKKMRVEYSVPSSEFPWFIPRYKSIPEHSCAYRAVLEGEVVAATENWGLRGAPRFRVEASAWGEPRRGNGGRVAVLLFPTYL